MGSGADSLFVEPLAEKRLRNLHDIEQDEVICHSTDAAAAVRGASPWHDSPAEGWHRETRGLDDVANQRISRTAFSVRDGRRFSQI